MPNWKGSAVTVKPDIFLTDWRIMETERDERHFVGARVDSGMGRVSSAIRTFDAARMVGITTTGKVYSLVGPPGQNGTADHVWSVWRHINMVSSYADVTDSALRRFTFSERKPAPYDSRH